MLLQSVRFDRQPARSAKSLPLPREPPAERGIQHATRRRGADLARTALTLQQNGRGEFILGIGSGEAESLLPFGYPFDRPVGLLEQALLRGIAS